MLWLIHISSSGSHLRTQWRRSSISGTPISNLFRLWSSLRLSLATPCWRLVSRSAPPHWRWSRRLGSRGRGWGRVWSPWTRGWEWEIEFCLRNSRFRNNILRWFCEKKIRKWSINDHHKFIDLHIYLKSDLIQVLSHHVACKIFGSCALSNLGDKYIFDIPKRYLC